MANSSGRTLTVVGLFTLFHLVIFIPVRGSNNKVSDQAINHVWNRRTTIDQVELIRIGVVEVTVINGEGKGGRAFAIHGMKPSLVHEWDFVGMELARRLDIQVYIPNLYSTPKTKPSSSGALQALPLLMKHYNLDNNILILGKSWGTVAAAFLVCRDNSLALWAKAIILANPINKNYLPCMHSGGVPLLYLSNKDDKTLRWLSHYEKEWGMDKKLTTFVGNSGGHRITTEFLDPIMHFVRLYYL